MFQNQIFRNMITSLMVFSELNCQMGNISKIYKKKFEEMTPDTVLVFY
jgi:hypothetical protein